jgi:hypothetical protein
MSEVDPCSKIMTSIPVSRETFLQEASFYSTLSAAHSGDRVILIRLPAELDASDFDGQVLKSIDFTDDDSEEDQLIGKMVVNSGAKTDSSEKSYSVKRTKRNLKTNIMSLLEPQQQTLKPSLSAVQQMRLGRGFDEFWSVNLGVEVDAVPIKKIGKVVKKRAEAPLVEQPRNLRMRLLPFSTPSSLKK